VGSLRFPELYVLLFSFLLNLVWEFLQAPLFVFSQQASVYSLSGCLLFCSGVDSIMTLTAYWVMACVVRDRYWFLTTTSARWGSFIGVALFFAFASEYTAIHYRNLWEYSPRMPVIPIAQIGLTPVLQWLLIPPAVLTLVIHRYRRSHPK